MENFRVQNSATVRQWSLLGMLSADQHYTHARSCSLFRIWNSQESFHLVEDSKTYLGRGTNQEEMLDPSLFSSPLSAVRTCYCSTRKTFISKK